MKSRTLTIHEREEGCQWTGGAGCNSPDWSMTYNKAVVSTITAVVQPAVGLKQEHATGTVVIVEGDAPDNVC